MEPVLAVPTNSTTEALFKVVVIGDLGVGKTSIIKRSAHGFYTPLYKATIGVDFSLKVYKNWENTNLNVRLQLWDIAGLERFGNMMKAYYKAAVGAFVVFDVTRVSTFEAVQLWKNNLDSHILLPDGKILPTVLIANKCDLDHDFNLDILDEYCQRHKFVTWFKCSAKDNIGIDIAVHTLTTEILANDSLFEDSKSDGLDSAVPAATTAQGAADEASALLRRSNTETASAEMGGDELEHYKQLAASEKEEKKAVITKLEHLVTDLNLCRDVITQFQGKCEYYQSLSEQFQQQLQHAVQLYQQSKSEVIQCTREKLTIEKQLERAQRVHHHLNRRLVTVEDQAIKERPSPQPVDQSMLEPYSITPTHCIKLDKKIGQGCYGSVYALRVNGDDCIGKRLLDILVGRDEEELVEQSGKDALHDKFLRECFLLSQMNHPNIVKFKGVIFGDDRYDLILLMEQLEMDLRKYLEKNKDIKLGDKVSILYDISNGLLYLHQQFVIHRDLTAPNILLTSSLQAKIADLGVSRIIDQSLSKFSTIPGTLAYMPPEALKGQSLYDKSLDIFFFWCGYTVHCDSTVPKVHIRESA